MPHYIRPDLLYIFPHVYKNVIYVTHIGGVHFCTRGMIML